MNPVRMHQQDISQASRKSFPEMAGDEPPLFTGKPSGKAISGGNLVLASYLGAGPGGWKQDACISVEK